MQEQAEQLAYAFLGNIKDIWQRNDSSISGEHWLKLIKLFREHIRAQYENSCKRFTAPDLYYVFLAEETVPMQRKIKIFINEVFNYPHSYKFFTYDTINSRLRVTITREHFTALCAAANLKNLFRSDQEEQQQQLYYLPQ